MITTEEEHSVKTPLHPRIGYLRLYKEEKKDLIRGKKVNFGVNKRCNA